MNTLSINGTTLPNVYVDASLSFNKPVKDVETFRVPGRNGALIIDNGTWDNVVITYPCYTKTAAAFDNIIQTLGALKGYQKIACSNDSTHYRMGVPIIPQTPTAKRINTNFYFNLSFNCKPQRFLTSGDTTTTYSSTGTSTLNNPTKFDSKPLLRITGNGKVTVNGTEITLANTTNYTDIDCEAMECYYGSTNRNGNVTFNTNDFPTLAPGNNSIVRASGITQVIITPRWWEL
jgi:phage-related protein